MNLLNRLLLAEMGDLKVVFTSSDWVSYHPTDQETRLEDNIYVPADPGKQGMALDGRPHRGTLLGGEYQHLKQTLFVTVCGIDERSVMPRGYPSVNRGIYAENRHQ